MIGFKRIDRYILSKFLLIFAGAFFICLFVFMMQFTWRYVDELIGKGLSLEILGQFFWYMGITLVPQALPLAVLLASLITFGNMGESLELLAMKAAGAPLLRIMRPIGFVALLSVGVSFYFQNFTSPQAQISLRALLFSMKEQQPAVEIPEGVFYNGVPNINIFVEHKNAETGMLYQTIIYKTDQGFEKAQIVLADSARMEISADKLHLILDLWNGEQFESLQSGGTQMMQNGADDPYDRETFFYKRLLIDFDSNFNIMDKETLAGMPQAKSMAEIDHCVDSVRLRLDSIGNVYHNDFQRQYLRNATISSRDSISLVRHEKTEAPIDFDLLADSASVLTMNSAKQTARTAVRQMKSDLEWKSLETTHGDAYIRRHHIEWHQKITFSLACLLFFFVGAPLGAIIRKGGLGLPTVISVIIFVFWYIINTSSMKMARDGSINMVFGMWLSTMIITPFGYYITSRANRDSVVFNFEANVLLLRRLLGIRNKRHVFRKEVIINEPRLDLLPEKINELRQSCIDYNEKKQLKRAPSYVQTFFHYRSDTEAEVISERMEAIIEELGNSRDPKILSLLSEFPFLYTSAHTSPFHSLRLNKAAGILFPVGFILWFRIWRFRLRLYRDMRYIVRTCDHLLHRLSGTNEEEEDETDKALAAEKRQKRERLRTFGKVFFAVLLVAVTAFATYNIVKQHRRNMRSLKTEQVVTPAFDDSRTSSQESRSSDNHQSVSPSSPNK